MSPQASLDVSVIVVNWNTREILRDCLASTFQETKSLKMEVIVIDNASSDGSVEMVREKFPEVILIANTENRGFAAANNQGIEIAKGRYLLLLNSDTVVLDGAIEKTVAYADNLQDTAVVGCRVLNPDRSLQPTCFMFPSVLNWLLFATYLYKIFPRSKFFGRERMSWWLRDDEREVDVVTGCYMLVSRSAVEDVGLLDERFFMYAEETDWCFRFRQRGWKNRFMPYAEIIHIGGASAPKKSAHRARVANESFKRYMFKHWSPLRAWAGVLLIGVFYLTRLAAVIPMKMINPKRIESGFVANHWAGLKELFSLGRA